MARISRSSVLITILAVVIFATLPSTIRRLIQTGDLYLFTERFFADLLARLSGPGRLRFILQPIAAILIARQDGTKDAVSGGLSSLGSLNNLGEEPPGPSFWFASVRDLMVLATLLDLACQYLIFREIHPGAALLIGPILIAGPYIATRILTCRIVRALHRHKGAGQS